MPISAYLNVFDDWDSLPEALACVDPIADEIVVVDGAYRWIAPLLGERDATRSRDQVYDALSPYASKTRVINAIWDEEAQKRTAGYEACSHRYVLRFDADELLSFDEQAMDRFFSSDSAVSELEMPIFVTPDFRLTREDGGENRQGALFDSSQISPADHLGYLWLVLPKHLQIASPDHSRVQREPFAFAPHLTAWRTPATSVNRARFYSSLYIANGGRTSWLDPLEPGEDVYQKITAAMSSSDFDDMLLGTAIVAGPLNISGFRLAAANVDDGLRAMLVKLHERYLGSLATLNAGVKDGRVCPNGGAYAFDLTSPEAVAGLGTRFRFDTPLANCSANLSSIHDHEPYVRTQPLAVSIDAAEVRIAAPPPSGDHLQRTLVLSPYGGGDKLLRFRSIADDGKEAAEAPPQPREAHTSPTLQQQVSAIVGSPDPRAALLSTMMELPRDPQMAIDLFESVSTRTGPQDYWAYYQASNLYRELGREDAAFLTALRTIDTLPDQPNWHMYGNAIEHLRRTGRVEDALALFARQLAVTPETPSLSRGEYNAMHASIGRPLPFSPSGLGAWRTIFDQSEFPAVSPQSYGPSAPLAMHNLSKPMTRPAVMAALVEDVEIITHQGLVLVLAGGELVPDQSLAEFPEHLLEKLRSTPRDEVVHEPADTGLMILDRFKTASLCHFLLDHVTRLAIYAAAGVRVEEATIIGPELAHDYQTVILDQLGVQQYIDAAKPTRRRFERLWVANTCRLHFRHPAHYGAEWATEYLRRKFPQASAERDLKLYISRSDASTRRIRNEDEVERTLAAHGFRSITLTGMPYLDQVDLFRRASHVVGLHGAGLTNLVFCSPGAKVLEIFHPLGGTPAYAVASQSVGLDYNTLTGRDAESEDARFNTAPDVDDFQEVGRMAAICNSRDVIVEPAALERWMAANGV